ncbi:betaine/proline/choline family ABC transporter ATP-binding protein [Mesorhizobium sp. AR07]|uniref:quaternary amine ABC transporter ATP-binding protein n=1 Tax=Mesorhizobium sp. AR07 TaxID=2865838 RepID=UPI0021609982|nr:betaine/proline/choline family ABC transporter ATP-binding protein [Mesorhizobium sp. AR07]UVK41860.1 betaine/proline/choline family ABC transporter ATP-binding protein [Mesorhizobium sp. AR07]
MTKAEPDRPVKLSCRSLWKVYGAPAERLVQKRDFFSGDPRAVGERLKQGGQIPAVIDASFDVHVGEIFVVMGLSGSGKSTLLRCLSRLIESSHGQVLLDGEDLLAASPRRLIELRRSSMGMVFQHFGLLPHLSVLDNVAFPLRVQGCSVGERYTRAMEMIALVGLEGRETSFPHQLSGGQQQRVGIARSLAVGPGLWFLDEPFSALDPLIRRQMQDEFLRLQKKLGKTIVFITHDIQEAFRLADRIAIMRQGEIIQIGQPSDILRNPVDDYVAQFVEDISLLRAVHAADIAVQSDVDCGSSMETVLDTVDVEELVAKVATGVTGFRVVNAAENIVGTIDRQTVLQILERDRERRH